MILNPEDMQIEAIATRNRATSRLQTFLLTCPAETGLPPFPNRSSSSTAPIFKDKIVIGDYRDAFKSIKFKRKKFD